MRDQNAGQLDQQASMQARRASKSTRLTMAYITRIYVSEVSCCPTIERLPSHHLKTHQTLRTAI
jgi:hypothetical protein